MDTDKEPRVPSTEVSHPPKVVVEAITEPVYLAISVLRHSLPVEEPHVEQRPPVDQEEAHVEIHGKSCALPRLSMEDMEDDISIECHAPFLFTPVEEVVIYLDFGVAKMVVDVFAEHLVVYGVDDPGESGDRKQITVSCRCFYS